MAVLHWPRASGLEWSVGFAGIVTRRLSVSGGCLIEKVRRHLSDASLESLAVAGADGGVEGRRRYRGPRAVSWGEVTPP